jgi:DNA polymerase-1
VNKNIYDPETWVAFDVETSGDIPEYALQPWSPKGYLTSYALAGWRPHTCTGKADVSARLPDLPTIQKTLEAWVRYKTPVVCWNAAFDVSWLIAMGFRDLVMQITWLDGMIFWRHLTRFPESDTNRTNRKSYRLKAAVAEFMPKHAGYDDDVDFHDMSPQAVAKRMAYNKKDSAFTLKLATDFFHQLRLDRPTCVNACLIECLAIAQVADSYITGLHVDVPYGEWLGGDIMVEADELGVQLAELGATPTVIASPKQLAVLLFDDWGIESTKKTPAGARSTDKEVLYELSFTDPRANLIKRYRELKGLKTKFVDKILESCEYNEVPITHPTANIGSTYTGRMTFSSSILKNKDKRQTGFAVHQMKRDPAYRRIIKAPDDWLMVEWDAAGQEYRWMAIESGDTTMLQLCQPGEDPHSFMGSEMCSMSYRDLITAVAEGDKQAYEYRQSGKVGNLSCQYRIGVPSLLSTARVNYQMPWDRDDAQAVYNAYHRTYPGIKKYWRKQARECAQNGFANTIAGRRILLEGDWGGPNAWQLESAAVNFPIQGVGADQKYLAMAALQPVYTKYGGKFYFELHDGIYAIFPKNIAEKAARHGQKVLNNLPYKKAWGFTPPIPLPWDIKIGSNWGDSKAFT